MQIMSIRFGENKLGFLIIIVIVIYFLGCEKNNLSKNSIKYNVDKKDLELLQINIENFWIDSKNVYFKTSIKNNSNFYYYFPVDNDISIQFNTINKNINSINKSSFYTQYLDEDNSTLLGFVYTPSYSKEGFRLTLDSLKKVDSLYREKYGSISNEKSMERNLWGIKYNGLKKNAFFLKPNEEKTMVIRSHRCFDVRAYTSDITCFDLKILQKVEQAQIILYIDSNQVKKDLLFQKDIDSLKLKNIKIFDGIIYSNKVPIKFD